MGLFLGVLFDCSSLFDEQSEGYLDHKVNMDPNLNPRQPLGGGNPNPGGGNPNPNPNPGGGNFNGGMPANGNHHDNENNREVINPLDASLRSLRSCLFDIKVISYKLLEIQEAGGGRDNLFHSRGDPRIDLDGFEKSLVLRAFIEGYLSELGEARFNMGTTKDLDIQNNRVIPREHLTASAKNAGPFDLIARSRQAKDFKFTQVTKSTM